MKWPEVPLSKVAVINPSRPRNLGIRDDQPVSFVTMPAVSEQTAAIEHPDMRPYVDVKKGFTYFEENDVLFAKITPCMENGKSAMASGLIDGVGFGSTEFHVIRSNQSLLLPKYVHYFVRQQSFRDNAKARMRGAVGQQRVPKDFFDDTMIPLPTISEQHRIVEILDQADRLRKLRAESDDKAQRILPALFIKMFGDPATNPMEWKVGTLGDVCERITDGTHQPPPFVENGIPFLFVQNIVKGFINLNTQKFIAEETYESLTRTIAPQKGDILYSTVGSYGVAVVVDTNRLFLFQRHIGHLRPKGALMDSWFLCAQMNTPYVKAQADQRARGLAQKTLNLSEIRQFKVVIPPVIEQKKFRLAMQNLEKFTGRVNDQEILIESLFKTILHRAFIGDLTASWREANMKELLQEMELQAKALAS